MKLKTDFVIAGAGNYGLILASLLSKKGYNIIILEKEDRDYINNSRGNSGVFHSGVYYKNDSLKKKVCMEGNLLMQQYCKTNNIEYNMCGKVILPMNKKEELKLYKLHTDFENIEGNKGSSKMITSNDASNMNLNVKFKENALFIKNCGYTDPNKVYLSLRHSIQDLIFYKQKIVNIEENTNKVFIWTESFEIQANHFINCTGNYSIKLAHKMGICLEYNSIDISANYLLNKNCPNQNVLVYPSPLNFSLGVHLTPSKDYVKFGPSVDLNIKKLIEYKSIFGFNFLDVFSKDSQFIKQLLTDYIHSNSLFGCIKMLKINRLLDLSTILSLLLSEKKSLTRSPLVNLKTKTFETDFLIKKTKNTTHLLNIQSPGWTSSFALCKEVMKLY